MMRSLALSAILFTFVSLQSTTGAPTGHLTEKLFQFGYLKAPTANSRQEPPKPEEITEALLKFQKFNGLKETGILDRQTEKLLNSRRCGNKDLFYDNDTADRAHPFNAVKRWDKTELTWNLVKYSETTLLSRDQQIRAIQKGLDHWSKVTPLTFKNVSGLADIMISFEKQQHGDSSPFDGPGGVLAHAFYPGRREINGNTHIDDAEQWTEGKIEGTNLEIVVTHEFGHALGLGHSENSDALMAPYYRGYTPNFKLHADDIAGIQELYGIRAPVVPSTSEPTTVEATTETPKTSSTQKLTTTPEQTTTAEPTTTPEPTTTTAEPTTTPEVTTTFNPPTTTTNKQTNHLCNRPAHSKIQAAFTDAKGVVYLFLSTGDVISNATGSHKIEELFPDGPKYVDAAAYTAEQELLLLVRGIDMWMYTFNGSTNTFSPAEKFRHKLNIELDAAAVTHDLYDWERIFFFSGQYMYEYQPYFMRVSDPLSIEHIWYGVPAVYDATFSDSDEVHFLHEDSYTSVSKQYNLVINAPRSIDELFGCA